MSRAKKNRRVQYRGSGRKSKRKRSREKKEATRLSVYSHPVYGDIPMVLVEIQIAPGKTHSYQYFDPDYKPSLPRGAVRGDVRKQEFCRMFHVPRYFYVDQTQRCVQCGAKFLFSADEQKYWYETLKFHFDSVAIRCKECRRQRRSQRALHRQLAACLERLEKTPEDPAQLVMLAETTFRLWERTGQGNLNRAIAATRKAEKLWPEHPPAAFWQACCQEAAGREGKALELFTRFCSLPGAKKYKAMERYALEKLAA